MQILGVRTSPTVVRYAILEVDGDTAKLLNAQGENKLDFPANAAVISKRLLWLYNELDRILRKNPGISRIVIKAGEYVGSERATSREAAYLDAVVMVIAEQRSLAVETTLYRPMGTKRGEVKAFAEAMTGQTANHWNEQMADAIAAAWAGRNR